MTAPTAAPPKSQQGLKTDRRALLIGAGAALAGIAFRGKLLSAD